MADCSAYFHTEFLQVLQSRRKIVTLEHGKPVQHPSYQKVPPLTSKLGSIWRCTRSTTPCQATSLMRLALPLTVGLILLGAPHVTSASSNSGPDVTPHCCFSNNNNSCSYSSHISVDYNKKKTMADCSAEFRTEFLQVLQSRRKIVPLSVEHGEPVEHPLYQKVPPLASKLAMETCPRKEINGLEEKLVQENLYLITEEGEQGRLPVLILSLKDHSHKKKPAIVFLHSSYVCKEWLRPLLEAYASRGYISIAIDARYHGERAHTNTSYLDALVSGWKTGATMPFIFDTVWDLIKLADYLVGRDDIDRSRIGITGESFGGMHSWFAAAADARYSVAVPIIGVQGFRWAIDNDAWQARVDSIKAPFEAARIDLGKSLIDKEVVEKVWDRIAPGMDSKFDAPYSIPVIAPRPLLLLNGADDPRCPLPGLKVPEEKTAEVYKSYDAAEKFKLIAEPGIAHQMTSSMVKEASDWFDKFL